MEQNDKIFEQFKNLAQSSEVPPFSSIDKVWDKVEHKLDKKVLKKENKLWKKIAVAASVLLIISITYFNIKTTQKEIITNDKKISETYFKIQLINSDKENIDFPEIKKLGEIETIKTDNYYIYRMGDYDTVEKAKDILKSIRENGYKMAFILIYNKNKVVGIIK